MDKKKLVELVSREAQNIKKNSSKKERDNLDFDLLVPSHTERCIYGQMTGDCYSKRAFDLISKCTSRTYRQLDGEKFRNGELNGRLPKGDDLFRNHFSPIEVFIDFPENEFNGNNKRLISYLKGKSQTLKFKPF